MTNLDALLAELGNVPRAELVAWVERRWVLPLQEGGTFVFSEVDSARCRLIAELRGELGIDDDTIPLLLALLDQIYALRVRIKAFSRAVAHQPAEVRQAIAAELAAAGDQFGDAA